MQRGLLHAARRTGADTPALQLQCAVHVSPHAEHAAPGVPLLLQSALKASSELAKSKAALEGDLQVRLAWLKLGFGSDD